MTTKDPCQSSESPPTRASRDISTQLSPDVPSIDEGQRAMENNAPDAMSRQPATAEGDWGAAIAGPLLDQFESLTRTLLGTTTVAGALQQIVDAAALVVTGAELVSVTVLAPNGAFYTPVENDPVAIQLDQVQYSSGRGPCLDAARPEGPGYVRSDNLATETRWPQFAAAASEQGYGAILSTALLPAAGAGSLSGALNIYSSRPHGLTRADRHAALLLATHGSLALAHAHSAELSDLRQTQLTRAIDTRDVIGQAKGILMNRQGITADEAFDLLRRTSQDLNVKLVVLARALTSRHAELDRSADRS
ncbi:MAG TPA: GAF and ANTAR domain-containing protein [Pseudonocardiaceae bacterium]|jgi:hypothetical protein|nr:GAF and ANTAR domain-containing protein [Pseudonocardiaceae bacterium]